MDHDSTDSPSTPGPKAARRRKARPGSEPVRLRPDLPPQNPVTADLNAQELAADDIDPATVNAEEDDEARLPEVAEESGEAVAEGRLAVGHAAIENAVRLAPTSPGVYRMLNATSDVLYVGKAKNVKSGFPPMPG